MQHYFIDKAAGNETNLCRVESYLARKEIVEQIHKYAHGFFGKTEKGKKRLRRALACYMPKESKSFKVFDEITGEEVDLHMINVIWRESAYINGDNDSAYRKFGKYEV